MWKAVHYTTMWLESINNIHNEYGEFVRGTQENKRNLQLV